MLCPGRQFEQGPVAGWLLCSGCLHAVWLGMQKCIPNWCGNMHRVLVLAGSSHHRSRATCVHVWFSRCSTQRCYQKQSHHSQSVNQTMSGSKLLLLRDYQLTIHGSGLQLNTSPHWHSCGFGLLPVTFDPCLSLPKLIACRYAPLMQGYGMPAMYSHPQQYAAMVQQMQQLQGPMSPGMSVNGYMGQGSSAAGSVYGPTHGGGCSPVLSFTATSMFLVFTLPVCCLAAGCCRVHEFDNS